MPRLTPEGQVLSQARAERFREILVDLIRVFGAGAAPNKVQAAIGGLFKARLGLALHCQLSASAVERWISGTRVPSRRHLAACEEFLLLSQQAAASVVAKSASKTKRRAPASS